MGGEAFKRRLVHGVALNFVPLLKGFTSNVLKCTANLNAKVKCVYVTMCFLVMSPFSRDFKRKLTNQISAMC